MKTVQDRLVLVIFFGQGGVERAGQSHSAARRSALRPPRCASCTVRKGPRHATTCAQQHQQLLET
eukprot:8512180-Alexandrium_andersonii.AAC.1